MLSMSHEKRFREWLENGYHLERGYYGYVREMLWYLGASLAETGYTDEGVECTLMVAKKVGGSDIIGYQDGCSSFKEGVRRGKIVSRFLRELADEIESGEC